MTASRMDFLCVGAAHWDIIGHVEGTVRAGDDVPGRIEPRPGGVALNVALGLAERECAVSLCSVIGDDEAGRSLLHHTEAAGVDCAHIIRIAGCATSHYLAIEDRDGNLIAAVADTALLDAWANGLSDRLRPAIQGTGSLFLDANLPATAISELAELAMQASVEIVANPVSPAKAPRVQGLLSGRHYPTVIANLEEAKVILQNDSRSSEEAAKGLRRAGARAALVTDGPRAVALATENGDVSITPEKLANRFSVTGAGDALLSAFLACPERHSSPKIALEAALHAARDHMTMHR
ncbi:MAG: PfkB family carbohydrate kinase [Pseudomonadota bacterium]